MFDLEIQAKKLQILRGNKTQKYIANQLNISQSYYSNMEIGKRPISYNLLNSISDRYKKEYPNCFLSLNWLILGLGEMKIKDSAAINIGVNNSHNTNIGIDGESNQYNTNKNSEIEIAILKERTKGLENENKSLKDIIKSLTSNM